MRDFTVTGLALVEYLSKWCIDLCSAKVTGEFTDLRDRVLQILVIVLDTPFLEHELVSRSITADIELAS